MEEDEFMEPSFGEMMDLIKQYEDAEKENRKVFFDEENYDHIVQFNQDNRENNKALRVANTAMEQYPFSSVFYTKKAEILANQKRFDEALPLLEEAERLDPNDINIFLIRADVHLWEGRHAEAMEVIESAIAIATEKEDMCELLLEMAGSHDLLVTVEEGCVQGGAGSAVAEALSAAGVNTPLMMLGLPDAFVEHGEPAKLLALCGLDAEGIEQAVRERRAQLAG